MRISCLTSFLGLPPRRGESDKDLLQISDDGERTVLVKLKTECGYQFTSKLESMFTDIKTSRDMMQEYKNHLQAAEVQELDVDLSVQARMQSHHVPPGF